MPRKKPLVFISHDSRDAEVASAFGHLLQKASQGLLRTFRSSDKEGADGIKIAEEWYPTIMTRLHEATDVVCLLTPRGLDRPWILYEAGVAKGRGIPLHGVMLGVPLRAVASGPFAAFQLCDGTAQTVCKLVLQLLSRIDGINPDKTVVHAHVVEFLGEVSKVELKKEKAKEETLEDQLRKLSQRIETFISEDTKYVGQFPDFYRRNIIECLSGAARSITVACDFPAYGKFSAYATYDQYEDILAEKWRKLTDNGRCHDADSKFSAFVLNSRGRQRLTKLQFPAKKSEWRKMLTENPDFRERLAELESRLGHSVQGPIAFSNVFKRDDEIAIASAPFKYCEVSGPMPIYAWIADHEKAVFSVPTFGLGKDVNEHGFQTTDRSLVGALESIIRRYYKGE